MAYVIFLYFIAGLKLDIQISSLFVTGTNLQVNTTMHIAITVYSLDQKLMVMYQLRLFITKIMLIIILYPLNIYY
jgi:hypothetical protein